MSRLQKFLCEPTSLLALGVEVLSHIKPDSFHNSVAGSRSEEEWAYLIVEGTSPGIQREEEKEKERGG